MLNLVSQLQCFKCIVSIVLASVWYTTMRFVFVCFFARWWIMSGACFECYKRRSCEYDHYFYSVSHQLVLISAIMNLNYGLCTSPSASY